MGCWRWVLSWASIDWICLRLLSVAASIDSVSVERNRCSGRSGWRECRASARGAIDGVSMCSHVQLTSPTTARCDAPQYHFAVACSRRCRSKNSRAGACQAPAKLAQLGHPAGQPILQCQTDNEPQAIAVIVRSCVPVRTAARGAACIGPTGRAEHGKVQNTIAGPCLQSRSPLAYPMPLRLCSESACARAAPDNCSREATDMLPSSSAAIPHAAFWLGT